jgi:nucleoside-diphosphate-sugar epimerase
MIPDLIKAGIFLGRGRLGQAWESLQSRIGWDSLSFESEGSVYKGDLKGFKEKDFPAYHNVVFALAPKDKTEKSYEYTYLECLEHALRTLHYKRFIFCSSSVVYGQDCGELVTEELLEWQQIFRSKIMLKAEGLVSRYAFKDFCLLRFSGLVSSINAEAKGEPGKWMNRVSLNQAAHAIDCALNYPEELREAFSISQKSLQIPKKDCKLQSSGKRILNLKARSMLRWNPEL